MTNTSTQKYLSFGDRKFVLVGTAHVSSESIAEVQEVIEEQKPDNVAIELDDKRLENLKDPESWRKMDIIKVLKNRQGFFMMANLILASYQKRMGKSQGVQPGDEMIAAMNKAEEMGIPQTMVDRSISVTLRRAWAKNSFWGKNKLLASMLVSAFSKEEVAPEDIEKLKQQSEMDGVMQELSDYLPAVKEVLIDERDRYLASHIWECNGNNVLAVLGAGHLEGVVKHLNLIAEGKESSDCSDIDEVPPKKLGSKIAGWIIPVLIVALIAMGFIFGGRAKGWDMLSSWVLWNGILAGIGTIIAGGHPLTVLVTFVAAPVCSLCPFIGTGFVAALFQAFIHKPKVSDMETLQDDAASLKGWYRNRIMRVLLVLIMSTIGSLAGTFIAGASFVAAITTFFDKIVAIFKK